MKTLWLIPLAALITITRSSSLAENEVSPSAELNKDDASVQSLTAEDAEISEDNDSNANVTKRQALCQNPQHQTQLGGPIQGTVSVLTAIPITPAGSQAQQSAYVPQLAQYPVSGSIQTSGTPQLSEISQIFGISQTPQGSGLPQLSQSSGLSQLSQSSGLPQLLQSSGLPQLSQGSGLPQLSQGSASPQLPQGSGLPQLSQSSGLPQFSQVLGSPQILQSLGIPQVQPVLAPQAIIPQARLNFGDQSQNIQVQAFDDEWKRFKEIYNKSYDSFEIETIRKQYYIESSTFITKFNQEFAINKRSYILKINKFADEQDDEYYRLHHGFIGGNSLTSSSCTGPSTFVYPVNIGIPKSIDWRNYNAVTRVRDQGKCACCHAVSAAGAIEGQYSRKTGQLTEFSVQNLIDCPKTKSYDSHGCQTGRVDEDFKYVKENPGIDFEHAYQFEARDLSCRFREEAVGTTITAYVPIPKDDEKKLEAAVATIGPISVGIDANHTEFRHYGGQYIYNGPCSNIKSDVNHAMLVVGYGEEANGDKYWILKNSAGTTWGDAGYMKLAKDQNNACGIASTAMYPLL